MHNLIISKCSKSSRFNLKFNKFKKILFPEVKMGNVSLYDLVLNKGELKIIEFISTLQKKYNNIYDLGANVGFHSAFYSQIFKNVVAYEPYDFHYKKLLQVKKFNKLKNLKIHNKAVAEDRKKKQLLIMLSNTTANCLYSAKRSKYGKIIKKKVNCESMTNINRRAELVKIDVEGYEGKLFRFIKFDKIKKNNADYIIELHNKENAKEVYDNVIKSKIYNMYLINGLKLKKINSFKSFPKKTFEGHVFLKKK